MILKIALQILEDLINAILMQLNFSTQGLEA